MKGGILASINSTLGFTIIETMIVLAISGIIFASAVSLMNGKQNTTEFSTGLGAFSSQLQAIINNVASGYYDLPNTVSCSVSGGSIQLNTTGGLGTGKNFGCIFIGDVLAFGYYNNGNQDYKVYPVIGLQYVGGLPPTVSTSLQTSSPTSSNSLASTVIMPYGLSVDYIKYNSSAVSIGAFGFLTTFNTYLSGSSQLNTGSQNIRIIPLPSSGLNAPKHGPKSIVNEINNIATAPVNPSSGINICLNSGTTANSALLTIGGNNSSSEMKTQLFNNPDCV